MFEFFVGAFNTILYQPLFNALILLYEYIPGNDFGIAIIAFTLIIKVIFYPLGSQGIKAQKSLQDIQPKIKELQEKFKDDKSQQAKEMMDLYKKEKINPFSGCLPLLIQLPILITVYQIFWRGIGPEQLDYLYSFIPHPGVINQSFLGLIDLSQPFWILAVITGIAQYFQVKMTTSQQKTIKQGGSDFSQMMQKQMLYFFPIFTVVILLRFPSALALYWLTTTFFTIGQQWIILKEKRSITQSEAQN
jgi:YidC/Oxa1 family membrane protein insertase